MFESHGIRVFSIGEVDVSVSLWFFILIGFIVIMNPLTGWVFGLALTLSILIHEFGHAIPSKRYGLNPSILLHGFGGLCFHDIADSDKKDLIIVLAGPILEIIVGVIAFAVLYFGGQGIETFSGNFGPTFLTLFAWVSVVWGLINLLVPLYPLDGGKILLLILRRFMDDERAQQITLTISVGVAIPVVVVGLYSGFYFLAFLGAFIGFDNYNALQSGAPLINRSSGTTAKPKVTVDVLAGAEAAFADEDWSEAIRNAHMVRGDHHLPSNVEQRMFEIIVIANVELGDIDEAKSWAKYAPDSKAIQRALNDQ